MAHTDKTRPHWVRLGMTREEFEDKYTYADVPRDFKWSNAESGPGPKFVKWAKRMRSKKNRRREIPHTSMRGYGWTDENYKAQ